MGSTSTKPPQPTTLVVSNACDACIVRQSSQPLSADRLRIVWDEVSQPPSFHGSSEGFQGSSEGLAVRSGRSRVVACLKSLLEL
jgi:hypothetical protein